MRVNVRPSFYFDLSREELWLLENAGAEVADRWHESVWRTLHFLQAQPLVGRLRSELDHPNVRSWRVSAFHRWLILYEVTGDTLILYRVVSGTMNLPELKFG